RRAPRRCAGGRHTGRRAKRAGLCSCTHSAAAVTTAHDNAWTREREARASLSKMPRGTHDQQAMEVLPVDVIILFPLAGIRAGGIITRQSLHPTWFVAPSAMNPLRGRRQPEPAWLWKVGRSRERAGLCKPATPSNR